MSTELSPDNKRYIDKLIHAGAYQDEGAALDEAVQLLRKHHELKTDVQRGIEQADQGELLPADAVFTRLENRAAQIEDAAGEA